MPVSVDIAVETKQSLGLAEDEVRRHSCAAGAYLISEHREREAPVAERAELRFGAGEVVDRDDGDAPGNVDRRYETHRAAAGADQREGGSNRPRERDLSVERD